MKKIVAAFLLMLCISVQVTAHNGPSLRRPISASQPAWLIHIDVWNQADPQKIIDLVPDDIRPYVIFNIATSSSDSRSPSGPAIYDSWLKTCAENRVWAMIQCASGGRNRLSDTDTAQYANYFRKYPNFLGFNFAEQFWGFATDSTPTFRQRLQLLADLLPVCHQYGGYLAVSFTQAYYSSSMLPMAYMKRNTDWKSFIENDPDHFLCFEKYTMSSAFYEMESQCLGAWLGGYAGQYGMRWDRSGWQNSDCSYVTAAGAIPTIEHLLLTGQTIFDGPELTWMDAIYEDKETKTAEGYTRRNWRFFPMMENINVDIFRKILDGTFRIPSREEVIARTKIAILNDLTPIDIENDNVREAYRSPSTLYDGLYRNSIDYGGRNDNNSWLTNNWYFKSTGRYPTIPVLSELVDGEAKKLETVSNSEYSSRWKTTDDKLQEFNTLFPSEYSGDIFAGRLENIWVTYNPYQYSETLADTTSNGKSYKARHFHHATRRAHGEIPLQYSTCTKVRLSYAPYTIGVMKERADGMDVYLTNYRYSNNGEEDFATDTIRIYGVKGNADINWKDRGNHKASKVRALSGVTPVTLIVQHNGPLEMNINCVGTATDRKTSLLTANISEPDMPPVYTDTLQIEAENADYYSVAGLRKNGYQYGHKGYCGLGFVEMGDNSYSRLNDSVTIATAGQYDIIVRFEPPTDARRTMYLYYNDDSVAVRLNGKAGQWNEQAVTVTLPQGKNRIGLRNGSYNKSHMFIDCIKFAPRQSATAIKSAMQNIDSPAAPTYNLAGQKVTESYKGIKISRRKKTL